jgi:hypothetical protein
MVLRKSTPFRRENGRFESAIAGSGGVCLGPLSGISKSYAPK